MNTAHSAA